MINYPSPSEIQEIDEIKEDDILRLVPHQVLSRDNRYILIAPDTSAWINVSDDILESIKPLKQRKSLNHYYSENKSIFDSYDDCVDILVSLFNKGLLELNGRQYFNSGYFECYKSLAPNFLVLNVTNKCNLSCSYCYSTSGKREILLDGNLALKLVDEMISISDRKVSVCFHGGEPLLKKQTIRGIVNTLRERYSAEQVESVIQTNATLIDDDFLRFAKRNTIDIGISLDGTRQTHDANRVFPSGKGSYESVVKGIDTLRENGFTDISAIVVVTSLNDNKLLDMVLHMQDIGITSVKFSMFVPWGRGSHELQLKPSTRNVLNSYKKILNAIIDRRIQGIFVQTLAYYIINIVSFERSYMCLRSPCGAGTSCLAMDTNADIYTCDCGVGNSAFKLGNYGENDLKSLLNSRQNKVFRERTVETLDDCRECAFQRLCCGTCANHAYTETGTINAKSEFECYLNRNLYEHLLWKIFDTPELLDYFIFNSRYARYFNNIANVK